MTRAPAVDVVIDNFDYGRFVAAAIESALAQDLAGGRVIVVDDGSTDDSRAVIERYRDRVVRVYKENGGQASALNAGWRRSRGDVVIFLDADDMLLPHAAETVAAAFAARPAAVKVQYRMEVMDELGRPTGELKPSPHIRLPSGDLRRSELTFPFDIPWMATSGNAFAAAALDAIMPIPESEFAASADWYLRHVATLLGEVVSLDEVCAHYRVHGDNAYERQALDLDQVRQTIRFAAATRHHLRRTASRLELDVPREPILSVSDVANRLISYRLDPSAHPIAGDAVLRLVRDGAVSSASRFDVRWPMRALFVGWFAAIAVAPRSAARRLASLFLLPRQRVRLNSILGRLADAGGGR
jgi:glycosyltransferase involved in cell wall biosynthesis